MIINNNLNNSYNINQKACFRVVKNSQGKIKYRTTSWFLRNFGKNKKQFNIDRFIKNVYEDFKDYDKVNVTFLACSDGEESLSWAYKFINILGEKADKFFPFKAFDIDTLNIKKAKSRTYYPIDVFEAEKIKREGNDFTDLFDLRYDDDGYPIGVMAKENIHNKIIYEQKDAMDTTKDMKKEKSIVVACDFLPYLKFDKQEGILDNLSNKLAPGSWLIFGDFDAELIALKERMQVHGFSPTQDKFVYRKDSNNIFSKIKRFLHNG